MEAKSKQQWSEDQLCLDADVGMQSQEQHSMISTIAVPSNNRILETVTEWCDSALALMPLEKQIRP